MSDQSKLQVGKKMRTLMFMGALFFTLLFSHFSSAFELTLICHMPEQNNGIFNYRERTLPLHVKDRFYYITEDSFKEKNNKLSVDRHTGQIQIDAGDGFVVYGHCQPAGKKKF